MERLAIVMSHADRSMAGAVRELHVAAALRARNVDTRIWRMHKGAEIEHETLLDVPVTYCPSDNPGEIAHRQISTALRDELASFRPEAVLYKGLGYAVNADAQSALPETTKIGLIVGGGVTDPLLSRAALVLGEYREQLQRCFPDQLRAGRAMVLPKYIDLSLAGDGRPPARPAFDIINVGSFAEKRKNQAALLPLTERHRCAFVGGGPLLAEMRRQVPKRVNAKFFGRLSHQEVFAALRQARIMVHSSTMDGLPRAVVEGMACGLPIVAYRSTIAGGVPPTAGLLVAEGALHHAVELLLADDELRRRMGRAARRHVETHHGPAAIAAAAEQALQLLRS